MHRDEEPIGIFWDIVDGKTHKVLALDAAKLQASAQGFAGFRLYFDEHKEGGEKHCDPYEEPRCRPTLNHI